MRDFNMKLNSWYTQALLTDTVIQVGHFNFTVTNTEWEKLYYGTDLSYNMGSVYWALVWLHHIQNSFFTDLLYVPIDLLLRIYFGKSSILF